MKDWLLNLVAKVSGVGRLWDWLDGKKSYGTGALTILGGVLGVGTELAPLLAAHNTAGLVTWATHVNSDPAYLAILAGAAIIAGAHKAEKVIAATAPAPAP